jgi:hypothetical protein
VNEQRLLLYCSRWQALRVGCLKAYSNDGGWTTTEGTERALQQLGEYTGDGGTVENTLVRLWRVINCLNAVRMGYSGQGLRGTESDQLVTAVRNELQQTQRYIQLQTPVPRKLNLLLLAVPSVANWERLTTIDYVYLPVPTQQAIYENLSKRSMLHDGRLELEWYLQAIRKVRNW